MTEDARQSRIPTRIKVGPFQFRVTTQGEDLAEARRDYGGGTLGLTTYRDQRIVVDPKMPRDHAAVTVLHETGHAIHLTVGIQAGSRLTDEEWLARTIPSWLATLRDNPELVEFLVGEADAQ